MLETGYRFQIDNREYKILELIGRGANTIAYLAERSCDGIVSKCILKEYAPQNQDNYADGKDRFITSGKMQNNIRQLSVLNNQTPPVSFIFEYSGIPFIDVSCYGGSTLSKLDNLSLKQYIEICLTIAKTVGYYHKSGYLCLDVKPENIFILQNSPDDTITQLIEFIDFDSIRKISEVSLNTVISCTKGWAAPEQLNPQSISKIGPSADIYTIGELVFYIVFGKHSSDKDHRGFSKYPFAEAKREYRKYIDRPDIQSLLTQLLRGTIRSSASNRFANMTQVSSILEELVSAISLKEYIVPKLPSVSPTFIGRDDEISMIKETLKDNHTLFIYGLGGIGKSTLAKNYIQRHKSDYDVIVFLEYTGDIVRTLTDDRQLQISTIRKMSDETSEEYFNRKLAAFQNICTDKRVLIVLDNFSGRISKDMSQILEYGYDTIITSRNEPPKNSFSSLEVKAISEIQKLYDLITLNLSRPITKDEKSAFEEIINLVHGHTLTIELIARQITAGHIDIKQALDLIRKNGFSRFSNDKISNYKDGEEAYGTLSHIISDLFNAGNMASQAKIILKSLSLMDVRGLDSFVITDILKLDIETIHQLAKEGWLYEETWLGTGSSVRLHPVITETVRNWSWDDIKGLSDLTVMQYYKDMADVYVGCDDIERLDAISKEAELYSNLHPRHIIKAIYHDIRCSYYDICCAEYVPYNEEEARPIINMINEMDDAIYEAEQSKDDQRNKYLMGYYIGLASILIRSTPDGGAEAGTLLRKVHCMLKKLNIPEYNDNRCYYDMVCAWYYTLIEPDIEKTIALTNKAKKIAYKVFPTELEIIDIIYIPTANCLYFHKDMENATRKLEEAINICKKYPDAVRYLDKQMDVMSFLLSVYAEINDPKSPELLKEIDMMNDTYKEQGIFREISQELRDKVAEIKTN